MVKIIPYSAFIKNQNIIIDLYQYYFNNGYNSIITEKIIRLLLSFIMIFLFNFLINCIDYNSIFNLSDSHINNYNKSLYQYIHLDKWFPTNLYLVICFVIYVLYLLSLLGNIVSSIRKFSKIRMIYSHYLEINDYRLQFLNWDNITTKILERLQADELLDTEDISIYSINNRICHQSNMIISMIRNSYLDTPSYSKFIEWNYIFCIIEPMTISKSLSIQHSLQNQQLSDTTINEISNFTNKDICIQYPEQTQSYLEIEIKTDKKINQPLLEDEIVNYESTIDKKYLSLENNYLDKITFSSTETSKTSKTYITDSIIASRTFDSILYNTLITDTITTPDTLVEYIEKVHYRIHLALIINLISLPFTLIILGLYVCIKYGEKLYSNPTILFKRKINTFTLWKLRYYNELPNLFRERIARIESNMDKIINLYPSTIKNIITRFLQFTIGSIFLILLILSFTTSEKFSQLEIIANHNIIWFLGICGTTILILNRIIYPQQKQMTITKNEQIHAFDSLREDLITIYPEISKIEDREYLVSLIHKIYKPQVINMFHELINFIIMPYYLLKWKLQVSRHSSDILGLIEKHYQLGNVCRHSIFTNYNELKQNPHMMISLKEFMINHDWKLPSILQFDHTLHNSTIYKEASSHF